MDKKIKKVTLIFENCDFVELPASAVDYVAVSGISTSLSASPSNEYGNLYATVHASYALVVLNKTADDFKTSFALSDAAQGINSLDLYKKNLFDFIKTTRDIASIELEYDDNTKDSFYVPWPSTDDSNSEYVNYAQNNIDNDAGGLSIEIGVIE